MSCFSYKRQTEDNRKKILLFFLSSNSYKKIKLFPSKQEKEKKSKERKSKERKFKTKEKKKKEM